VSKSVCGRNVTLFVFFGGQFVQSKVCFCKGYLSFIKFIQSSKRLSICAPCWGCFWSVYLCTMRGCFWSLYLLFDLCTIGRHGCKFCWPSTLVVVYAQKWMLVVMPKYAQLWHKPQTKWAQNFLWKVTMALRS